MFRFGVPNTEASLQCSGAANIVSHPREIASAVRRVDDSRKLSRQAKAERKAEEKAKREEETKRLKGEKRRQIEKQLAALKAEFGEDALEGLDLEGDWDEAKHEAAVQKLLAGDEDDVRTGTHCARPRLTGRYLNRKSRRGMMKMANSQMETLTARSRNWKSGMKQRRRESRYRMTMKVL